MAFPPEEFLAVVKDRVEDLAASGDMPAARHHFEEQQLRAINAALAS